ncbi:MAG: flippase activity-associated protein Agl23 [Chloroflexota bacterium]
MEITTEKRPAWLDRSPLGQIHLSWELIIFGIIVLLAVVTRFYLLEPRVMSHDENSHVYYSWLLYKGNGYSHDPVTHGPLQFHLVALAYFLFNDSDTAARIPAVLFSIASVAILWVFRRYLGRAGALVAALLLVISPYMLYYGRYVRNEAFVVLFGLIMLWATLRYLETGRARYLLWLTGSITLHFATKETAYMYVAELLIFLALYFVIRILTQPWPNPAARTGFLVSLVAALALAGAGGAVKVLGHSDAQAADAAALAVASTTPQDIILYVLLGLAGLALLAAIFYLMNGQMDTEKDARHVWKFMLALVGIPMLLAAAVAYGKTLQPESPLISALQPVSGVTIVWTDRLMDVLNFLLVLLLPIGVAVVLFFVGRYAMKLLVQFWPPQVGERSLDLLILAITLFLPTLAAFLIKTISTPTDYSLIGMVKSAIVLIPLSALAVGLGVGWNPRLWLANAALFYGVFVVFYTTFFTNGQGFFTGIIGGLGYWLEQQGVNRGSQPGYYYALVQIPFYEFLPALGSLLAAGYLLVRRASLLTFPAEETEPKTLVDEGLTLVREAVPAIPLVGFWCVASLLAFSYAGEKMPWLTVHIALPLILLTGWFLGQVIENTDWAGLRQQGWPLLLLVLTVFVVSASGAIGAWVSNPPFQGQELAQLQSTATFLTALVVAVASGIGLFRLLQGWEGVQVARLVILAVFAFLGVVTARSAFLASYVNYDKATELLVYAHSAPGVKIALAQIEEISRRTTGGLDVQVAFDNETTYPYWWYLRDYPNQHYYGASPTRDLRDYPLILIGDANFSKIEPIVGKAFEKFEYNRIWWPNQDYFDMTPQRYWEAFSNPELRAALFDIWWYRDYTKYAQVTSTLKGYPIDMSLQNWSPAAKMRLYVRKDIAAQLWDYGAAPVTLEDLSSSMIGLDEKKEIQLRADLAFGVMGAQPGELNNPRGMALADDGSLYVADTGNHRIQHFSPDGELLHVWGQQSPAADSNAPEGTFSEPWDVAVGPDGSVYVADTWNHRVQKFTAEGKFVTTWGYGISQSVEDPFGTYGPRGIAVDKNGLVYITDTGNKRVIVYDENGEFVAQLGEAGYGAGQFDEPVGLAVDQNGLVFVVDTWNQRIQSLQSLGGQGLAPVTKWDVDGWYGKGISNYPYIAVDGNGHVFITDPDTSRVIEYTTTGELVRYWGIFGSDLAAMNLPTGIAATSDNELWVVDSGNHRILHFTLPVD